MRVVKEDKWRRNSATSNQNKQNSAKCGWFPKTGPRHSPTSVVKPTGLRPPGPAQGC